jgi:hypothetical protein
MDSFERYKENPGINASSLKLLSISPRAFKKEKKEFEKSHFTLGKAVDTWLCFGKEKFLEQFYVPSIDSPTAMLYAYAKFILDGHSEKEAYDLAGYKPSSMKRDTVKAKLIPYKDWMEEASFHKGKLMIQPMDFLNIQRVVEEVLYNPFTKKIFQDHSVQVELYWEEIMGNSFIPCKALPDIIQEYEDKVIITDIKTTAEGVNGFRKTILKYRYDLQASWYCHAVQQCMHKPTIFQFLVIDLSAEREPPSILRMSEKAINDSKIGFVAHNGFKYKGWEELLNNYYWHLVNNKWEYSEEVYRNNGIAIIEQL